MLSFKSKHCTAICQLFRLYLIFVHSISLAASTEVTESSQVLDSTLDGLRIHIPVLVCHVRNREYTTVAWFKDDYSLKMGGIEPSDHVLSLVTLLPDRERKGLFDNPLQLQGYYWCLTDNPNATEEHKYLFRIKEVSTYVGKFIATKDAIEENEEINLVQSTENKKSTYESELSNILFPFLSKPNVHVTDALMVEKGVEVHFFLYFRQGFHPRSHSGEEDLVGDHENIQYILDYLHNRTEATDEETLQRANDWMMYRGVSLYDIVLRSTVGCYVTTTLIATSRENTWKKLNWPNAYIGEVVIPQESCASSNGAAVTRMCKGSFNNGAWWSKPTGKCDVPASILTESLRKLHQEINDTPRSMFLHKLQLLTQDTYELSATDLHIILTILLEISNSAGLKRDHFNNMFTIIDNMMDSNETEIEYAKNTIHLTKRLITVMDNLLKQSTGRNKDFYFNKKFLFVATKTKLFVDSESQALKLSVSAQDIDFSLENATLKQIEDNSSISDDTLVYIVIPPEAISQETKGLNLVLFKNWLLFPSVVKDNHNIKKVFSPIVEISVSDGPIWNLEDPVKIYFKDIWNSKVKNPVCVYLDDVEEDAWNTEGCEFAGMEDGFYCCHCHHLSTFAIAAEHFSDTPFHYYPEKMKLYGIIKAFYIGCGISIVPLSFVVLLFAVSKYWRKTVDHSILFWICFSFLCALILLFASERKFKKRESCMVISLFLHYFIIVTFSWILVQAFVHKLRFGKKSDIEEIPHFAVKAAVCALGIPILIMVIVWLTRDYKPYKIEHCFLATVEFSKAAAIPILVLYFFTLFLNLCALYSVSCRFKKDFLIGDGLYNASVLKFRTALAISLGIFLSWLFGFWCLHERSSTYAIVFAILIITTSFSIAFLFVFYEHTFWEKFLQKNKKEVKPEENPAVEFVAEKKNEAD